MKKFNNKAFKANNLVHLKTSCHLKFIMVCSKFNWVPCTRSFMVVQVCDAAVVCYLVFDLTEYYC